MIHHGDDVSQPSGSHVVTHGTGIDTVLSQPTSAFQRTDERRKHPMGPQKPPLTSERKSSPYQDPHSPTPKQEIRNGGLTSRVIEGRRHCIVDLSQNGPGLEHRRRYAHLLSTQTSSSWRPNRHRVCSGAVVPQRGVANPVRHRSVFVWCVLAQPRSSSVLGGNLRRGRIIDLTQLHARL